MPQFDQSKTVCVPEVLDALWCRFLARIKASSWYLIILCADCLVLKKPH